MLIQDYLDICDPVLTFDRFMGEIALENQCKVNLRFIYLMDHQAPSYRTFGYFINEVLADSIEEIFQDILIEVFLVSIGQSLYKYRNKQKKSCNFRIEFHNSIHMGEGELYPFYNSSR